MLTNLKISTQLVAVVGLLILSNIVAVGIGVSTSASLRDEVAAMHARGAVGNQLLAEVQDAMWQLRFGVSQYVAVPEADKRAKIVADTPKWYGLIDERIMEYSKLDL